MKTRKIISILLALVMVSSALGFSAFAADVTEPVKVLEGEDITIDGNVTVEDADDAVYVCGGETGAASVKVNGDVSLKIINIDPEVYFSAYALSLNGADGAASANITGNISVEGGDSATGIYTNKGDVVVGKNVSAKGDNYACGIDVYNDTVKIGGDVSAEATYADGVWIYSGDTQTTTVEGAITTTGKNVTGAELNIMEPDEGVTAPSILFTAKEGITAKQNEEEADDYSGAMGLVLNNAGGKINADITGDVVAESAIGNAVGISVGDGYVEEMAPVANGTNEVLIHGSLISDGAGITKMVQPVLEDEESYDAATNILIENELDAKEAGVVLSAMPVIDEISPSETEPESNINLTVWKINLNEDGNAAAVAHSIYISTPDGVDNHYETELVPATEFEKTINYIVKVEQPEAGGTIKAVKADGTALEKNFETDTAKEGDKIILDADLEDGYSIKAAYNGSDEKTELEKDEDGNYYIVVPKGGGVYLSVELEKEDNPDNPDNPDKPEPTVEIKDYKAQDETGYKESKVFAAVAENMPENAEIHWFVNGKDTGKTGETYTAEEPTDKYTVQAKIIDGEGEILAESSTESVTVKNGFFDKILWFFTDFLTNILKNAFGAIC